MQAPGKEHVELCSVFLAVWMQTSVTRLVSLEGKWSSKRVAASGSFVQLKQESEVTVGKISLLMSKLEIEQRNTACLLKSGRQAR